MIFLGIDPGLDGGMGALGQDGSVDVRITPTLLKTQGRGARIYDVHGMKHFLEMFAKDSFAALEKQQPMRGQGVSSTFSIGKGYGLWEGMLAGLGIPYVLVHPKTWQKAILMGEGDGGGTKERSIMAVQARFPKLDLRASERSRLPHDGKADAVNLALYAKQAWALGGRA